VSDYRILVTDPLADEGLAILEQFGDVELSPGLSEDELVQTIVGAAGLVVRSGTQVTERIIQAADKLQIIARAGVGVDNIDVSAATACGILVVNCPAGNTVAAAEHTIAMLLAAARNIPQAHAALKAGRWDRKRFMGRQVADKTVGIIGLGHIGSEVARRARGLQMQVLAYDPYLSAQRAEDIGVQMCSLEELLQQADFVTIHTALTDETRGMIGTEQLALMKPQAIIINCARGGILDETGLLDALNSGQLAGAALDVFEDGSSPNPDLVALDNVVVTPHLGASTSEAQVNVAVDAARQVVDVLSGQPPRWPVNMPTLSEEIAAAAGRYLPLVDNLARLQRALVSQSVASITVAGSGDLTADSLQLLSRHFVAGLLGPGVEESVNYINAFDVAGQRGIEVAQSKMGDGGAYVNLLETTVQANGEQSVVAGTLTENGQPRIVSVAGFETDLVPAGIVLFIWNDQPGVPGFVGRLGTLLGEAEVSISGLEVARGQVAGEGLMVCQIDQRLGPELQAQLGNLPGCTRIELVDFG